MPVCRECGTRITKFDKDRCPVCGCVNPIVEGNSNTVDITAQLDFNSSEFKNYKPKRRSVTFLLFVFLGVFGAPFYYLKFVKTGLIALAINIILIAGVGSILSFLTPLGVLLGYIIPLSASILVNIALGLIYLLKPSIKDGNGEFIK